MGHIHDKTGVRVADVNTSNQLQVIDGNSSDSLLALQAIKTAVELLDDAVSGTTIRVSIVGSVGVSITNSIPAGTNNIGDVDIASSLPSGDNNIGNVDVVTLPDGAKDFIQNQTPVEYTGDYSTAQTATSLWTPASSKKFVLTDLMISVDTAMTVTLLDSATTIRKYYLTANGGTDIAFKIPFISSTANNILKVTTSTAGNCFIHVMGYEI